MEHLALPVIQETLLVEPEAEGKFKEVKEHCATLAE